MTINFDNGTYHFDMEERFPNPQILKGFHDLDHFKDFLDEIEKVDTIASLLSFSIENLINFTTEMQKIYSIIEGKSYDHIVKQIQGKDYKSYSNEKNQDINESFNSFKIDISQEDSKKILLSPFFMFRMIYNFKDGKGSITNLVCNRKMYWLIDVLEPKILDDNEGYYGFEKIITRDWLRFYIHFINFFVSIKTPKIFMDKEVQTVTNKKHANLIENIELIKKVYIEDLSIMTEIYFKFNLTT